MGGIELFVSCVAALKSRPATVLRLDAMLTTGYTYGQWCVSDVILDKIWECSRVFHTPFRKGRITTDLPLDVELTLSMLSKSG